MFEMLIMNGDNFSKLDEKDAAYVAYLTMYEKTYKTIDEYRAGKENFLASLDVIQNQDIGKQSYILGLNHMSDWSDYEYLSALGLFSEEMSYADSKK